ncbi:unnamed protein product, partial [Symbiodinium sp. CCMP2456]
EKIIKSKEEKKAPVAPVRRRRRVQAAPVVPAGSGFVREGELQVEQEMGAVKWTVTSGPPVSVFVEVSLELAEDANVFLHWGSAPGAGCEWEPISALPANATAFDEIASRTPVQGQARATLIFPKNPPRWVSFVLYVQTGPGEMWLKREGGDNFWIP